MTDYTTTEDLKTLDEAGMRAASIGFPKGEDELLAIIRAVAGREHDYGTCVYAMSIAGTAAMNYIASKLGMTGFQASCADMDVVRRQRGIEGPFAIFNAADLRYPQYDLHARFRKWVGECGPWVAESCAGLLAESPDAHPNVIAHWEMKAAALEPEEPADE